MAPDSNKIPPLLKSLVAFNNFPHYFGAFPATFDKKAEKFMLPHSSYLIRIYFFISCLNTLDLVYLWLFVVPRLKYENLKIDKVLDFYAHTITRTCGACLAWQFFLEMPTCLFLVNLAFSLEKYFKSK